MLPKNDHWFQMFYYSNVWSLEVNQWKEKINLSKLVLRWLTAVATKESKIHICAQTFFVLTCTAGSPGTGAAPGPRWGPPAGSCPPPEEFFYKKEEEDITTTWPRAGMARRGRASRASMLEVPLMGPWDLKSPSIGTLEVPLQVPARSALYTCRVPRAAAAAKEIDRYEAACSALELRLQCKDDFLMRMFINFT